MAFSVVPVTATVTGGAVVGESTSPRGVFIKLSVPLRNPFGPANSVGQDTFESPNLYAFDEDQNIHLKADLAADVGQHLIPAGKVVASHYVFFDPGPGTEIFGVVDFDSRVLAIITGTDTLAASDFLANTGVHYLSPSARGLEPGDYVTISDTNQITFHTVASSPGDYVRVLTEFSPKASRPITSLRPLSDYSKSRLQVANGYVFPSSREVVQGHEAACVHAVNVESAVQVIDFVLQDACVPARRFNRPRRSVGIKAIDTNAPIARHNSRKTRQA